MGDVSYDDSLQAGQPEMPARVVRCEELGAAPLHFSLAIQFNGQARSTSNGNGARHDPERRRSARRSLAVPIRVRVENIPWFEEAMLLDFSPRGMCFHSLREYATGEFLRIALEDASSATWPGPGEFRARVVRVAPVAVVWQWMSAFAARPRKSLRLVLDLLFVRYTETLIKLTRPHP